MSAPATISVLIAHPSADTIRFITTLLDFEPDIKVVGTTRTGEETLRRVAELNPQIVLLASDLPDIEAPKAILQIAARGPRHGVIVVSANEDPDFLRRCMQSGARSFLVIPFKTEQLVSSIRTVCTRLEAERAARARLAANTASPAGTIQPAIGGPDLGPRVVAFFGSKGGVGKTTCSVNVAVALRQRTGKRVALVDGDFSFGDLHLLLNLRPEHTILDYVEHIREADADYVRSVTVRHETGIRVLPAPIQPEHAELIRPEHLKPLIDLLTRNFDFVVIDTPANYDERTLTLLDAADTIFVVTLPEVGPLNNTVRFLQLAQALGYTRDKVQVVLNRADSDVGITPEDVAASIGRPLLCQIPSRGRQMAIAANLGQPYIKDNAQTDVGRAFIQMADIVAGRTAVGAG